MYKSYIDIIPANGGLMLTLVHTGKVDDAPPAACFVKIDPGAVKSPEIIDDCCHKLQGIVCFQVERLEALHRKRGRVGLGE